MRKILSAMLFVLYAIGVHGQQQITGTIYEKINGETMPLPFANVFIPGTTRGVTSDFDGKYQIEVYDNDTLIKVSYMGYTDVLKSVDPSGAELTVDVTMSSSDAALQLDAVTVTAKKNMANENMLLLEQKKAVVVKESIGAKQLSNLGISDAAAATSKIAGVTQNEGSGDIYVRGLGDRYLSTTMNGLPIPSDDVSKKNIDLTLFPTDIIENVSIGKTYSVATYGDQASGQVDISSKKYSEHISVGLSGGANTNVVGVFSDFKGTQNQNDLKAGFYNKPYETVDAINQQSWNTTEKKMPLNYGLSLMGGKKWLGENTFTLFATLSHDVESKYAEGIFRKYRSNAINNNFTDATYYQTEYNTTGLLNASYEIGQKTTLNYNSLWISKAEDELYEAGRNGEGFVFDQDPSEYGAFVRDQNLKQTNIFINQLLGEHKFSTNTLNWAVGYNKVNADEPNRIRNEVNMPHDKNNLDKVQFAHVGDYQQRKTYQDITDNELNGFLKDQYRFLDEGSEVLNLNVGLNFRRKSRDFESQFVGVRAKGQQVESIDNMDEALLDMSLYEDNSLKVREGTPDTYNATLGAYAGYASVDFQKAAFSGNLGLRYELDHIYVKWDVGNYVGRTDDVSYDYNNLLPSINLKYSITEKNLVRFAASKTVTLPEFKELAPFEYVSPTGRVTKGNPELQRSIDYNFDVKWEMYMRPKELLSLSAFAKMINDPINLAQTRGSSGYFYYANTGEQAQVYGLELEGRFNIINATSENTPGLRVSFNVTKMWFNQDLLSDFQYNGKTEVGLQGASDFIANGALTYTNNKEKELLATISANYSSDKIFALGSPEDNAQSDIYFNNEIIEKGFVSMDFILKKKFSNRISAKLYAKNILNPDIEWTQEVEPIGSATSTVETVESYRKGVKIGLGVIINLN